jgi:hypothetical protein
MNLNCFQNAFRGPVPDIREARGLRVEYALVSLFPKFPNNKTWHKLPNFVYNWDFVVPRSPIPYSDGNASFVMLCLPHDYCGLVPDRITDLTLIKYMFHGFFLLVA